MKRVAYFFWMIYSFACTVLGGYGVVDGLRDVIMSGGLINLIEVVVGFIVMCFGVTAFSDLDKSSTP